MITERLAVVPVPLDEANAFVLEIAAVVAERLRQALDEQKSRRA